LGEVGWVWLSDVFREEADCDLVEILRGVGFVRSRRQAEAEVLQDRFAGTSVQCAFLSFSAANGVPLWVGVNGAYQLQTPAAGGWLLLPAEAGGDSYWVPQPPMLRRFDKDGHILSHRKADITGFEVSASKLGIALEVPDGHVLDLVVWRIPAEDADLFISLQQPSTLELQRYFLWSSHTSYEKPADVYLHLVHGHVYENHEVWPKYWRVCSELDAYGLYVTLTGLLRATGKRLYDLLRIQVVFSIIARQAEDGGWYHGEWSNDMESHYRLHAGGMHMLAAYFEETHDPVVGAALKKAAAFAALRIDRLNCGMWYLHDSLEENTETLKKYPFRFAASRALGKSPSNLLVLNTHLDTNIAMQRYRQVTGDAQHDALIASANATTKSILELRPAEWLYRPLFRAIGLTFLPVEKAKALSLPLRVIKRIAWKYLLPKLPQIKARFPRLVMPGGFIERDLVQFSFSVRYQPVNLMDLIRTRHLFNDATLDDLLEESFAFTQQSGIKERWKEFKGKEDDSLGFWAEALYHHCLVKSDARYRAWLAEAIMDLEDNGLGLSPSLLGANAEAIPVAQQRPCPSPVDARLRLANMSQEDRIELLVVNPSNEVLSLEWDKAPAVPLVWHGQGDAAQQNNERPTVIPPRAWLLGVFNP
jgi:hypothetical protein